MYLSADDARSDFFLAAAVYVIGPTILGLLLRVLPGLDGLGIVLAVLVPALTIAAMPLYLLRYREGSFAVLRAGGAGAAGQGAVIGAPLVVGVAIAAALSGTVPLSALDLALPVVLAVRWLSLAVLAVFLHLRAEYAFRPYSEHQETLVRQAGVGVAGTAVISTLLLLLVGRSVWSLLAAAGLVAALLLAERRLPQQGIGERWWTWAPLITLALGPLDVFGFLRGGAGFLLSAQAAATVAGFGLLVVMARTLGRGGAFAFGLAAAFWLAEVLAVLGGVGYSL